MRLTIFKGKDGDCNLVTGSDDTRILVDGGRSTAYQEHVAPKLGELHASGAKIHRLCVSHIDDDHISGVLKMLDHKVAWKVHRHHRDVLGNTAHAPPSFPEPPDVDAIWHNGFSDVTGANAGAITDQLATRVSYLSLATGAGLGDHVAESARLHNLVQGEEKALRLRARLKNHLQIPINPERDGNVMGLFEDQPPFAIGGLTVHTIGPYFEDLEALREEWNEWLEGHSEKLDEIRRATRSLEEELGLTDVGRWLFRLRQFDLEIGDTSGLTTPNVASIMFLVEEGDRKILMTGDGGWDVVLSGLENAGQLRDDGTLHVDVFKVPHHGSEYNTDDTLPRRVTADHYVFCANGAHHNPDEAVVLAYVDSRLGSDGEKSTNPEADRPFTFWFTYSPNEDLTASQRAHMTKVRDLVAGRAAQSNGRFTVRFLEHSHEDITLG